MRTLRGCPDVKPGRDGHNGRNKGLKWTWKWTAKGRENCGHTGHLGRTFGFTILADPYAIEGGLYESVPIQLRCAHAPGTLPSLNSSRLITPTVAVDGPLVSSLRGHSGNLRS